VADDFASFRAAHPTASAAIAACDRLDWLVLLAREVADEKSAMRIGLLAARLAQRRTYGKRWMWNPFPEPLESVDAWIADDDDKLMRTQALGRGLTLASLPAAAIAYVIITQVTDGPWTMSRLGVWFLAMLGIQVVLAFAIRALLHRVVRARAARLDEAGARAIVMDEIHRAPTALLPDALRYTRTQVNLFAKETA